MVDRSLKRRIGGWGSCLPWYWLLIPWYWLLMPLFIYHIYWKISFTIPIYMANLILKLTTFMTIVSCRVSPHHRINCSWRHHLCSWLLWSRHQFSDHCCCQYCDWWASTMDILLYGSCNPSIASAWPVLATTLGDAEGHTDCTNSQPTISIWKWK